MGAGKYCTERPGLELGRSFESGSGVRSYELCLSWALRLRWQADEDDEDVAQMNRAHPVLYSWHSPNGGFPSPILILLWKPNGPLKDSWLS